MSEDKNTSIYLPYIGIDIGGSLTKLCITVKKSTIP